MNARWLVVFVLCVTRAKSAKKVDIDAYCKLSCSGGAEPNTVCKYKFEVGAKCSNFSALPLTQVERQFMLDRHNELRQNVASGNDTRGGNGAAANMVALNYDIELEVPAMSWGMQCHWGHDKCRSTPNFPDGAGQNLYESASSQSGKSLDRGHLERSMDGWYVEIADTAKEIIEKFDMHYGMTHNVMIGHYTQLVWATTTHVGCTRVSYQRDTPRTPYVVYVLCNYGPPGNWHTLPVYKFGKPASMCPKGMNANVRFRALCGKIEKIPPETLLPGNLGATGSTLSKLLLMQLIFVAAVCQSLV